MDKQTTQQKIKLEILKMMRWFFFCWIWMFTSIINSGPFRVSGLVDNQVIPLMVAYGLILLAPWLLRWVPAFIITASQAATIYWLASLMSPQGQIIIEMACLPVILFQELTMIANFKRLPVITILYLVPFFIGHKVFWVWIILCEAILTVVILTYASYISIHRRFCQAEELLQINAKLQAANRRIADLTSQRVRQEVARDLHDTLTQDIVGINMQLAVVKRLAEQQKYEQMQQMLAQAESMTTSAIKESRKLIQQYRETDQNRPKRSLKQVLLRVISDMQDNYQLTTTLKIAQDVLIDRQELHDIAQVVNEALMNVVKHAQTRQATVEVCRDGQQLTIQISDPGRRFNPPIKLTNHYGIKNMNERAAKYGGKVTIKSLTKGVRVVAHFNIKEENRGTFNYDRG